MADKQYYRDVDRKDTIVVKVPGQWSMLFFSKGDKNGRESKPDDPYEREYYFGEGSCCLFSMTEEEALALLKEWNAPAMEA